MKQEIKLQLFDLGMIIVIFSVAILMGNSFVNKVNNILVGFYLPSGATLALGGTVWRMLRKRFIEMWDEADRKRLSK